MTETNEARAWPKGTFYTCDDTAEQLDHESPEEAIEAEIARDVDEAAPGSEVVAAIRARAPLTLFAWSPIVPTETEVNNWADDLLERLEERWGEEHDPEGDMGLAKEAGEIMREATKKIIAASPSWTCRVVGKIDLTAEEVEETLRDWCPEWFEEDEDDGADHAGA